MAVIIAAYLNQQTLKNRFAHFHPLKRLINNGEQIWSQIFYCSSPTRLKNFLRFLILASHS